VGDGNRTKYLHDQWLQVQSPKDIAPTIFKLAWRKNNTVAQGLNKGKWMQGLQRMATPEQIQQFIKVRTLAAQV
jgi:hypothetical protein